MCVRATALAFALTLLHAAPLRAAPVEEAKAHYDAGAAAYDTGDFGRAANAFARADEVQPNDMVLAMALRSAIRAEDAVLAMTLATRAEERSAQGEARQLGADAKRHFAAKVGRVQLKCAAACIAQIGAEELSEGQARWVRPGRVEVSIVMPRAERRTIEVAAGKTVVVEPGRETPEPSPPVRPEAVQVDDSPTPRDESGLSPVWFWTGVGLTTALAGISIWSSLDTRQKHEDFDSEPTDPDLADDGEAAELRTNVFWGVTAGVGVATLAIGVFATRWGSSTELRASATPGGAALSVRRSF